ncbi:Mss4-like protein [Aspergillus avenaceus]|uniref:Mss4-like protein n=1 Tax=Aspergillus avenaceus TaxID=36643 RepID=A0A5N6U9I4_ASPAV|nr:Mss4-like protein [Aspergillus avenaceus]
MTTQIIKGSCLCNTIKYTVTGPPILNVLCYCRNCQKSTGSLGVANSLYKQENLSITEGQDSLRTYKDSNTHDGSVVDRSFCQNCGSNIVFSNKAKSEDVVIVTSGTMDLEDGQAWAPMVEFYCQDKKAWLDLGVETKTFEKVPLRFDRVLG